MTAENETLKPDAPLTTNEDGIYVFDVIEDDAGTRVDKWLSLKIEGRAYQTRCDFRG